MDATLADGRSVFLITLGCAKNRVDSEVILGTLVKKGWRLVERPQDAQVIVVNTCSFIHDAKQESVQTILQMAEHKKAGTCRALVVAGCLPQRYAAELLEELPEVDHFVGTGAYVQVADLLDAEDAPRALIPDPDYIHDARTPRINSMPSYTAYVKISEGCDNKCAFCVIPQIRGAQHSRPAEDVVAEVRKLARDGCVELNLIAQDLTAWGNDLPGRPRLHTLLRELCKVKGPRWIRLHYAYPRDFPDELIEVIAGEEKIVKYLDMPLQHVSDKLLRSMRRGRGSAFIKALLGKLRERVPGLVLRTSLIVGLPGETEEDFAALEAFVREQRFERLGVFEFSPEEGTSAAMMEGQVPAKTVARRRRQIMAVQRRINREQNRALVGSRIQVLAEGSSPETEHLLVGRHSGQSPEIDGVTYINDGMARPGEIVTVEVTQAADYDVVGHVVPVVDCGAGR
ncbi:MAG: 30S ribosomal protein S12 methylthiotransferase RimO [Deltaproteobacteria bacterium]|nr:30S ribosomal protein S12 methylthiotransferase RimO [Deltaproteobacteria bacterium]